MQKPCNECNEDMFRKWPKIAAKLEVCPDCCQTKSRKTTTTFGSKTAKAKSNHVQ